MNSMSTNQAKGVIYYRVSTEEQAAFGVSLVQQQNSCRDLANQKKIDILELFSDDGVSAKTKDRAGLQKMLAYCMKHSKEIDYLIVYKVDRLSRNVNDYSSILVLLNKLNIRLLSVTEAIDETPVGRYVGNLMAANAQFDNDVRGERTKACMMTKVEQGSWCWKATIGYKNIKTLEGKPTIALDPERAPLIIWAFVEFSKGICTLEEIRVQLNEKGLRTRYGNEISPQMMSKIIRNKFFMGIMVVNKKEYQGVHTPLIDEPTFLQCQARLRGENTEDNIAKKRKNEAFPLRHQTICCYCGRPMTAAFSTNKVGNKYPFYRCYYKQCPTKIRSIPKETMEKEYMDFLQNISGKQKFMKAFKAVILDVWDEQYELINNDRERINKNIENLEKEKKSLIQMKKKELLPDADFKNEFDEVNDKLVVQHDHLEATKMESFNINEAVDYVFDIIARLPEVWHEANFTQKQQLQCLIFPEKPIYTYGGFETPKLSPILALNQQSVVRESMLVPPRGIEPLLPG